MSDNRYISNAKDDTFEETVLRSDLPVPLISGPHGAGLVM